MSEPLAGVGGGYRAAAPTASVVDAFRRGDHLFTVTVQVPDGAGMGSEERAVVEALAALVRRQGDRAIRMDPWW